MQTLSRARKSESSSRDMSHAFRKSTLVIIGAGTAAQKATVPGEVARSVSRGASSNTGQWFQRQFSSKELVVQFTIRSS